MIVPPTSRDREGAMFPPTDSERPIPTVAGRCFVVQGSIRKRANGADSRLEIVRGGRIHEAHEGHKEHEGGGVGRSFVDATHLAFRGKVWHADVMKYRVQLLESGIHFRYVS